MKIDKIIVNAEVKVRKGRPNSRGTPFYRSRMERDKTKYRRRPKHGCKNCDD